MKRRDFLIASAASIVALRRGLSARVPAVAPADAWPQFRGTPSLTGLSATTIGANPQIAWTWEGGEAFDSSPSIADGMVYVGTATGELIAVNLTDGTLRWRHKAGESIGESSPAIAGGRVFVGDLDGVVHAVNAADGKKLWTYKTQSEIKSSPVVVGDLVLIGSYDGKLYGLGAGDGALKWSYTTENYVHGTPSVIDGVAHFAGCDEKFHAVGVRDGRERYATSATAYTGASVALVDNVAYFGTFDNQVLSLDLTAKKVRWRYEHPDRKFPFYSSAAFVPSTPPAQGAPASPRVGGTVVLGGRDRMVHALDAQTGKPRWTFMTRARIDSSPAIAGDRVYVGSNDGRLYALDLASGKVAWQHDEGAAFSASPALASGRIVIGSVEGRLLCFG